MEQRLSEDAIGPWLRGFMKPAEISIGNSSELEIGVTYSKHWVNASSSRNKIDFFRGVLYSPGIRLGQSLIQFPNRDPECEEP